MAFTLLKRCVQNVFLAAGGLIWPYIITAWTLLLNEKE
jgi:hypothetical protein